MNEEKKTTHDIEEEVNWKKVLSNPIRWFGFIYPMFIVAVIAGGFYYIDNMSYMIRNEIDGVIVARPDSMPELQIKKGSIQAGVDVKEIAVPSDELLNKGQELYSANCASCHGAEGKGDGVAGSALNPSPRNFHEKDGWKNGPTISGMYRTLQEGIEGGGMVAYEYLPVKDKFAMIHYIRENFIPEAPKADENDLATLDMTYQLSQGAKSDNQIPVDLAMKKVIDDHSLHMESMKEFKIFLAENINSDGAKIFDKYIHDEERALNTLISNPNWRQSSQDLMKIMISTIPQNGFEPGITFISDSELEAIFSILQKFNMTSGQNS